MATPGYYKTNMRALRFRELKRMFGPQKVWLAYLKSRFAGATGGNWMPGLWAENQCAVAELSEDFWTSTKRHRAAFERLGFTPRRFSKSTKNLNPGLRNNGAILYLHSNAAHVGQLIFLNRTQTTTGKEFVRINIAFTAVYERGTLNCTNSRTGFDRLPEHEISRVDSYDAEYIYTQFLEQLRRRTELPRTFSDLGSLKTWYDEKQIKTFEEKVRRGLFVPMTDQEVAQVEAGWANGTKPSAVPRLRFKLSIWFLSVILILTLRCSHYHISSGSADTIDYRGQQFKLRKAYASYEDYKDDPDNLNTNELPRIEEVMANAPIPSSFKDNREFVHSMFDLGFPGYGIGGIPNVLPPLYAESVEIPGHGKERYVIARDFGGRLQVVDDFIAGSETNTIRRVELKEQTLRYYDAHDVLVREKELAPAPAQEQSPPK